MSDYIEEALKRIERKLDVLLIQEKGHDAPDYSSLDAQYGDPALKFKVTRWSGEDYKGRPFSECPPDLLDLIADSLEYFGKKADDNQEKTAAGKDIGPFKRKDAERARLWARRKREGWQSPADMSITSDDIPF